MNKKLFFQHSCPYCSKMKRYRSYMEKIMRFGTSHKGVFCVWCAECAKYLAFGTFGTSAMDALHWEIPILLQFIIQKAILSLYHTILQYLQHPKTLFLLKYYFLIILYYFFPTVNFFQTWHDLLHFPGLSNSLFFFLSFSFNLQHRFNTQSHTHTQTHDTLINLSKPITTHTEPHTYTQNTNHQTINKATHTQTQTINRATHTQTIKPVRANNGHHTHHPSHRLANPSHRSETHVANLKPKLSKIPRKTPSPS